MEIDLRSLPELPKQVRVQNNIQKHRKKLIFTSFTSFNTKIVIKYFLSRFVLAYYFPIFLCGTFIHRGWTAPGSLGNLGEPEQI